LVALLSGMFPKIVKSKISSDCQHLNYLALKIHKTDSFLAFSDELSHTSWKRATKFAI